jgi:uncharacterized BrkB/YihY/UPF0761 family membrane protein
MLSTPRRQSRRERAAAWQERVRARALAVAPRAPGYERALRAVGRDRGHGGGLLAGALAFRLFGALLPLGLLIAVLLGYAATLDRAAPEAAADAVGIRTAVLQSVADSSKLSAGTRWTVILFAVLALLWSSMSAARAIRAVHSLAWEGRVSRVARPIPAALALLAAIAAFAALIGAAGRARAEVGAVGGILITVVAVAGFFGIWLVAARLLPHADAPWRALVPGAVLVAVGVQLVHLGTVLFVADRVERASETYGSLGVAFTILVWLYVVSRVIVASAMLNASQWERRG